MGLKRMPSAPKNRMTDLIGAAAGIGNNGRQRGKCVFCWRSLT
jgi:hypothetical protein